MKKTIICIGGTSRSGSTLLDLILSNDPKAMSLGEIHALFRPTRVHHFEEIKNLKNHSIWSKIIKDGKKKLYPNLIKFFPEIDVFVDSSKDPFWFGLHEKVKSADYEIKHILIYKSPSELAHSFIKRGQRDKWIKMYIHYHKKYLSIINRFIAISYIDLINNKLTLKLVCEALGLEYFETKMEYWKKEHGSFFGSNSVKGQNTYNEKRQMKQIKRKDITYDGIINEDVQEFVNKKIRENSKLEDIENKLNEFNIHYPKQNCPNQKIDKYSKMFLYLIRQKQKLKNSYLYYFPNNIFSK